MSTFNTACVMQILGSCNILFYFNLLINVYTGVFVGDFFLSQRVCFTRWPTSILEYIF